MNAVNALRKVLGLAPRISREKAMAVFTRRYASFKELLQANADLAGILPLWTRRSAANAAWK